MKKTKITIIGGASTYTPGIFASLVQNIKKLNLSEVNLYDINKKNLKKMHTFLNIYAKQYGLKISITKSGTLSEAIKDSSFVFVQIREGGLEMRLKDEEIAVKHGVVGQETCGPGGFAFAFRQIQSLIDIVKTTNKVSPNAWILNYSNPIAIVAEAVKKEVDTSKVLWICDQPIGDAESYSKVIDENHSNFIWEHIGLNHFYWYTSIKHKKTKKEYIDTIRNAVLDKEFKKSEDDNGWFEIREKIKWYISRLKEYLPTTYMQYYFFPKKSTKKLLEKGHTRAYDVINGRGKKVFDLIDKTLKNKRIENEYKIGIHGNFIVDQAVAILNNKKIRVSVNLVNNGYVKNLPDDWIIEASGILDANGPKFAKKTIGNIPSFYRELIVQQKTYEILTCEAWKKGSYDLALKALVMNKIVNDLDIAKEILDEYIRVNKKFWPKLK